MPLTHLDSRGQAHMVDVSGKDVTARKAVATARVLLSKATMEKLKAGSDKGDALAVARIAGIGGAKKTSELIPLCHPLPLSAVSVDFDLEESGGDRAQVVVRATTTCTGRTGVEMEAMTAASVAALTLYDMLKSVERGIVISEIRLERKTGGASGEWNR